MKRTYQPHNKKRINKHGFRKRMSTHCGCRVLASRRRKGRKFLTVHDRFLFKGQEPHGVRYKNSTSNRKVVSLRKRTRSSESSRLATTTWRRISASK